MIPFENKIPTDGEVFKLVTTTMSTLEKVNAVSNTEFDDSED